MIESLSDKIPMPRLQENADKDDNDEKLNNELFDVSSPVMSVVAIESVMCESGGNCGNRKGLRFVFARSSFSSR